jgi:hypothetical protein
VAGYAGAVYNSSSATRLSDCFFQANTAYFNGGGVVNYSGSPAFDGCTFLLNSAVEGGAASNYTQSSVSFSDCSFRYNAATHLAGAVLNSLSDARYTGCSFESNSATQTYPYGFGGAIFDYFGTGRIEKSVFRSNSASYTSSGGAIYERHGTAELIANCLFSNNVAGYGGGVFDDSSAGSQFVNNRFLRNTAVTHSGGGLNLYATDSVVANCVFSGNETYLGGGIYCQLGATATITNCTLGGNSVLSYYAGGVCADSSTPKILNTIVWGNRNLSGTVEDAQLIFINGSTPVLKSCCVQNWSGMLGGSGNMGSNPRFRNAEGPDGVVGTEDDDLRLSSSSPAIDRGDNTLVPPDVFDLNGNSNIAEPIPFDADNHSRFVRWRNQQNGMPPIVDLGSYEFRADGVSLGVLTAIAHNQLPTSHPNLTPFAGSSTTGGVAPMTIGQAGLESQLGQGHARDNSASDLAALPAPQSDQPAVP